jgi:hypothetical protein
MGSLAALSTSRVTVSFSSIGCFLKIEKVAAASVEEIITDNKKATFQSHPKNKCKNTKVNIAVKITPQVASPNAGAKTFLIEYVFVQNPL